MYIYIYIYMFIDSVYVWFNMICLVYLVLLDVRVCETLT